MESYQIRFFVLFSSLFSYIMFIITLFQPTVETFFLLSSVYDKLQSKCDITLLGRGFKYMVFIDVIILDWVDRSKEVKRNEMILMYERKFSECVFSSLYHFVVFTAWTPWFDMCYDQNQCLIMLRHFNNSTIQRSRSLVYTNVRITIQIGYVFVIETFKSTWNPILGLPGFPVTGFSSTNLVEPSNNLLNNNLIVWFTLYSLNLKWNFVIRLY